MRICLVSCVDLGRASGDTIRVASLTRELSKNELNVSLIIPKPTAKPVVDLGDANVHEVPVNSYKNSVSISNMVKRNMLLIRKAREIQKNEKSLIQVETGSLGGYFSLANFSNFTLDFHALGFSESRYQDLPWYMPSSLYQMYLYNLEKLAIKRASKVFVVSYRMKKFFTNSFRIPEEKIEVIPNGYFGSKIKTFEEVKETKGRITFIGLLARWAAVDKIINAAHAMKDTYADFYIVGDGPDRKRLERMAEKYKLKNITFTGFVSVNKAYELMARSEILLSPFPKTLALEVACPIKLLEYAAMAKPIVVDNVGEIPEMLRKNKAALVSDPIDEKTFIEKVVLLLHDPQLRRKISSNAKRMSKDFTWEIQVKKLAKYYKKNLK